MVKNIIIVSGHAAQVDSPLVGWITEAALARGAFGYIDELARRGNMDELQARLAAVRKRCKVLRTANEVCFCHCCYSLCTHAPLMERASLVLVMVFLMLVHAFVVLQVSAISC